MRATYLANKEELVSELTNQSGHIWNHGLLEEGEASHDCCRLEWRCGVRSHLKISAHKHNSGKKRGERK